jgi:hypothetical protein
LIEGLVLTKQLLHVLLRVALLNAFISPKKNTFVTGLMRSHVMKETHNTLAGVTFNNFAGMCTGTF